MPAPYPPIAESSPPGLEDVPSELHHVVEALLDFGVEARINPLLDLNREEVRTLIQALIVGLHVLCCFIHEGYLLMCYRPKQAQRSRLFLLDRSLAVPLRTGHHLRLRHQALLSLSTPPRRKGNDC